MKNAVTILLVCICLASCKKGSNFCGIDHPTTSLSWLKAAISDNQGKISIHQQTYNNIDGFFIKYYKDSVNGLLRDQLFVTCSNELICNYNNIPIPTGTGVGSCGNPNLLTYSELIYPK